jgi:hypothetical protein
VSWVVERYGVSTATARALTHVGAKAWDIPNLIGSLCAGEISFDKVRAVADVATHETDRELCGQAREHSVRNLADIARSAAEITESLASQVRSRSPLSALQRPVPHHHGPAARRVLRRGLGPPSPLRW